MGDVSTWSGPRSGIVPAGRIDPPTDTLSVVRREALAAEARITELVDEVDLLSKQVDVLKNDFAAAEQQMKSWRTDAMAKAKQIDFLRDLIIEAMRGA